jgi:glycosylphosphatidylinositol phospholipase D
MRHRITLTLSIFSLFAFLLAPPARPCGMSTHDEISQRARTFFHSDDYPAFDDYLAQQSGALQAGSVFPDWGYSFGYPDESEAAHWPPYLTAYADYLHDTYPQPWDEDTIKSAVFLLGAVSHSVADFNWHFTVGPLDGFITTMSKLDFHGNYGDAHTAADFGGDVLTVSEIDLGFEEYWYVAAADAAAVYQEQGYTTVTPEAITSRMGIMFVGSRGERIVNGLLFDKYAAESPFMTEQFLDYHFGGLDDMAAWTAWTWPEYIADMENGLPVAARHVAPADGVDVDRVYAMLAAFGIGPADIIIERDGRGVTMRLPDPVRAAPAKPGRALPPPADRSLTLTTADPYAHLGTSLATADLNGDGYADLVVGAPGYGKPGQPQLGAVYVLLGRPQVDGQEQLSVADADFTLTGRDTYGRFGWSVALVDLNADGKLDLVVSSPTIGAQSDAYTGRVDVFFGDGAGGFSTTPDVVITATDIETVLGYTMLAGDVDGDGHDDLILGMPFAPAGGQQRGQVTVFRASAGLTSGRNLTVADADWTLSGEADHDWFGYSLALAPRAGQSPLMLVGAPTVNVGDVQSAGRVYGYTYGSSARAFTITAADEFQKFGASLSVLNLPAEGPAAVVGAPTESQGAQNQVGAVHVIPLAGLSGDRRLADVNERAALYGDAAGKRFGWRTTTCDLNGDGADDLWVSQPWLDHEAGDAHLWFGGDSFPTGAVAHAPDGASWTAGEGPARSLAGNALVCLDFNGDGYPDLALGERRDSRFGVEAGAVTLLLTPAPSLVGLAPDHAAAGESRIFMLSGERFIDQGLSLELRQGDRVLRPAQLSVGDAQHISFSVDIPADAPTGAYDLTLQTDFGAATLTGALTIEPSTADDDVIDDDAVDDDAADDDTADDDSSDDDASPAGDDDNSGCGC